MGQYKSQHTGPQIDAGVDAALNPDVTVTPDSDALVTSGAVADALDNIDPTITGNTDTTLNGILVGNGSKVGTKSLDTSSLTNDGDHVPVSSVVKSAINSVENDIAIRVVGNKTTYASGAAIGQYVIVSDSSIAGIADGMYKAAKAIPYNTGIDSTYLTAVSGGGLNDLKSAIDNDHISYTDIDITGQAVTSVDTGGYYGGMNITSLLPADVLPLSVAVASGGYEGGISYTLQVLGTGTYIIFGASKPVTISSSNRKLRVFWKKWN